MTPAGWETKSLGEVCEFQRGLTYAKRDEVEASGNVVLRATNVDLKSSSLDLTELRYISDAIDVPASKRIKKDSLLVCTASGSKSHVGKVAMIDADYGYAFGGFMGQLTATPGLLPRFMFYLLTSAKYKDFIAELADGTNINNLKWSQLQSFQVLLPPLEEQKRIVAILDAAFADIDRMGTAAATSLAAAAELADAEVDRMFGELAGTTAVLPLIELAETIADGDHSAPPKATTGVPFITISNIEKRYREVDFSRTFFVPRGYFESLAPSRRPRRGDVLFTVTGSFGIPVVVDSDREFCFQRHIGLIRPVEGVNPKWLALALRSRQVREQVDQGATGTAQRTVSLRLLRSLRIPSISADDQARAVSRTEDLEHEIRSLIGVREELVKSIVDLRQSLLHQAFSGQL